MKARILAVALTLLLAVAGCAASPGSSSDQPSSGEQGSAIVPVLSAEESAKKINNRPNGSIVKVHSEKAVLYQPTDSWGYSHHASIAYFKGKLYALYSNGRANEDDCGQRVMLTTSENFTDWTTPKPLADTSMGKNSELVKMALGLYVYGDTLVAYYGIYEHGVDTLREPNLRPLAENTKAIDHALFALTTTDGETWEQAPLTCPFTGNFGPIATKSGRLIMCGATIHPYTDDPTGLGKWSMGVIDISGTASRGAKMITEGSFFQTDDGILRMMLRTGTDYLFCSESYDDGMNWTEPYPTNFTDDNSKFQFGELPDGRFFYVGNPYPGSNRNPLMLCLSDDGINFDQQYILRDEPYTQKLPGMYKGGVYGYPNTTVADGYLYVIYSKHKEAVEVTRVALTELK